MQERSWDELKSEIKNRLVDVEEQIKSFPSFDEISNLKSQIDELKSLTNQIPELRNSADNINQFIETLEQKLDDLNSSLPAIEEQLKQLSELGQQIPVFQDQLGSLNGEIQGLENSIQSTKDEILATENEIQGVKDGIQEVKDEIQALKDDIGQIGGGSSENWVLLYDMDSEDPDINLGFPKGIQGKTYTISKLPNLRQYSKFKIVFCFNYNYMVYIINLDKVQNNVMQYFAGDSSGQSLVSLSIGFNYVASTDILSLYVLDVTRIDFIKSKYPTITSKNDSNLYYVSKIEAST